MKRNKLLQIKFSHIVTIFYLYPSDEFWDSVRTGDIAFYQCFLSQACMGNNITISIVIFNSLRQSFTSDYLQFTIKTSNCSKYNSSIILKEDPQMNELPCIEDSCQDLQISPTV